MKRSTMLQRQTNLLGALEAVIGEPVPRSVAKTGPVLSVIASAFRREQGIGVMRERRQNTLPAALKIPVQRSWTDHSKHHCECRNFGADNEFALHSSRCPAALAWLDELRKLGSK